jgi:two-component system uhpT operon response regulator UhpA
MSLKIRILSNNADVRRQLKRLIDPHPDWKVVGATACDKAITGNPLKHPPDVVIAEMSRLDASMVPFIAAICNKSSGSKILALSRSQDSRLVLRTIHAGANGYLVMDRAAEELAAAIKTVASGGLYLSPGIAGLGGRRPLKTAKGKTNVPE